MIKRPQRPDKKIAGYWYADTPQARHYPKPFENTEPWPGQVAFLRALERKEAKANKTQYRGFSRCRICQMINGSSEYETRTWKWPVGLRHYIIAHNVRPSQEFVDYVLGVDRG